MLLLSEHTSPFISRDRNNPAPPESVMVRREYDARECPICHGEGSVSRKAATIGEAVATAKSL